MSHHYKADIRWSEEDKVYIAKAPELEGVITHGETLVEAASNLDEAIEQHLRVMKEDDVEIPSPVSLEKLSGNYALRMGKERHQDATIQARSANLSFNEYINTIIDRAIELGLDPKKAPAKKQTLDAMDPYEAYLYAQQPIQRQPQIFSMMPPSLIRKFRSQVVGRSDETDEEDEANVLTEENFMRLAKLVKSMSSQKSRTIEAKPVAKKAATKEYASSAAARPKSRSTNKRAT